MSCLGDSRHHSRLQAETKTNTLDRLGGSGGAESGQANSGFETEIPSMTIYMLNENTVKHRQARQAHPRIQDQTWESPDLLSLLPMGDQIVQRVHFTPSFDSHLACEQMQQDASKELRNKNLILCAVLAQTSH